MEIEELEFLISQDLDGTLDAAESARLNRALADDAYGQSIYDQHARIDGLLRSTRTAIAVDADWLASRIAARIDDDAGRPLRMPVWMWGAPVAAAAVLMIGLTLGVVFLRDEGTPMPRPGPLAEVVPQVTVTGPAVAVAAVDAGYANVSIGVPTNLSPAFMTAMFLSQDVTAGQVSIRPAGRTSAGHNRY